MIEVIVEMRPSGPFAAISFDDCETYKFKSLNAAMDWCAERLNEPEPSGVLVSPGMKPIIEECHITTPDWSDVYGYWASNQKIVAHYEANCK